MNTVPLIVFAAVLIIAGVQLLAIGLLGEMHVTPSSPDDSTCVIFGGAGAAGEKTSKGPMAD